MMQRTITRDLPKLASGSRRLSSTLASDVYTTNTSTPATTTSPTSLTAKQRRIIEEIIRVDQAGELGANVIYQGQKAVFAKQGKVELAKLIQEMWDSEKKHIQTFDKLVTQHRVRPTALYPVWRVAGWALGATTAMMGRESAMACTEAVETVIGEHYNDQIKELDLHLKDVSHPSIAALRGLLEEFRDDELEHLDTAVENDSQKAPAHALLSAVIAAGCKAAVQITRKV